jgi:TolB-like protein/Tfp pilus assembly protein PilF
MIDTDGNAKIMDFGIARSLREEGLTRVGYAVGTPTYMAPEQVEGQEVDTRTDIYSLGVVLYEMVTGKPPFRGDTEFSVASKHLHMTPAHPATLNPLIPGEMSRIILKCLQKDKRNRFQSAADLCAALDSVENRISPTPGKTRIETFERKERKRSRDILVVAAVVAAAVALSAFVYFKWIRNPGRDEGRGEPAAKSAWLNSIAVIPFEDLSPGRTPEYICESLTDDIQTKLASNPKLKVPSRLSTKLSAEREKEPRYIGKKLGVANVLEATVQTQNGELQVNVRLVRTEDEVAWRSKQYPGTKETLLGLEDRIIRDLSLWLGVELTAENLGRSKRKDPKDERDYEVFLTGRHFEKRFSDYDEEGDFKTALKKLNEYISSHPNYALAYCSLGNVYEHHFALYDNPADEDSMRRNYEKAYEIDPNLEETNLAMGWSSFYRRAYDRSYEYFKKAVALGPDNPEVNWNVGSFFRSIGLDEKSLVHYEKALVTDPLNTSTHMFLASSYMYVGEYEKGLNSIEKAVALEPENIVYLAQLARLLYLLHRPEEALLRLGDAQKRQPGDTEIQPGIIPLLALSSAIAGDRKRALSLLEGMRRSDRTKNSVYDLEVAGAYSLLGMKKEALQTIEEGIQKGFAVTKMELYCYPLLHSYPCFDNLRNLPQFKAIEGEQKELYETRLEKYKDL